MAAHKILPANSYGQARKEVIMKTLFLLLILFSVNAFALDECYTGSWYESDGEGVHIVVRGDDSAYGFFFTYGQEGYPRWYVLSFGENDIGPIYSTTRYGESEHVIGSASLDVFEAEGENAPETLLFVWNMTQDTINPPWCLGGFCVGDLTMTRILTDSCN